MFSDCVFEISNCFGFRIWDFGFSNMRLLVTGSDGMVASRFLELYGGNYETYASTHDEMDITDLARVEKVFMKFKPDAVLHSAAYTDIGGAEKERGDEEGSVWDINVNGTMNLVSACKRMGVYMCYISSDYVFEATAEKPGPYSEEDEPAKGYESLNWYGWTKLMGEKVVKYCGQRCSIVRISYPYRASFDGKLDYTRKILKLYDEGKLYPMFDDQVITPSFIDEISAALVKILGRRRRGVFHIASHDSTTPYHLACYLIERMRGEKNCVASSSVEDYLEKYPDVHFPMFGGLDCRGTEKALKVEFMGWREAIDEFARQSFAIL